MRKWFLNLPGEDLAYFSEGTDHFDGYVEAVGRAQDYAALNRRMTMMTNLIRAMRVVIVKPFDAERRRYREVVRRRCRRQARAIRSTLASLR